MHVYTTGAPRYGAPSFLTYCRPAQLQQGSDQPIGPTQMNDNALIYHVTHPPRRSATCHGRSKQGSGRTMAAPTGAADGERLQETHQQQYRPTSASYIHDRPRRRQPASISIFSGLPATIASSSRTHHVVHTHITAPFGHQTTTPNSMPKPSSSMPKWSIPHDELQKPNGTPHPIQP
ncbi:hypothetical protein ACLOJK_028644 [Asimina triloba]